MSKHPPPCSAASPGAVRPDSPLVLRLRRRAPDLLALAVLAGLSLVLHGSGLSGGQTYYESDTALFYFPLANWAGEQLRAGVFPLWLPDIFTGYPIFADGETGLAYLPQILALWALPAELAIVWLRFLHVILAGGFAYAFFRTLRLTPLPALAGALVFAFGSFITAQMHHENMVRSAVWLPLVLAMGERALGAPTARQRVGWASGGAIALGQAGLGLHIQAVAMTLLALGLFLLGRVPAHVAMQGRPRRAALRRGAGQLLLVGLVLVGGGVLIAAVQWLPLLELSRASFRRLGVSYEFASAFGIAPANLATLLFPYFFRLPDGATWWMLWQPWEIALYVGIPTLALALIGTVAGRNRAADRAFFLALGAVGLLLSMAQYAPLFNLHALLWQLPGFSFLRAPGRFSYLVVFAAAGLAALGLQALLDRGPSSHPLRWRWVVLAALPPALTFAAILIAFPLARGWLAADPARGQAWVEASYLSLRAQGPIDAALVYAGFLASLELTAPKTAWTLVLLAITAALLGSWSWRGGRAAQFLAPLLVALLALDLLVFAMDFHPRTQLAGLRAPAVPEVPLGGRVLLDEDPALDQLQPNRLLSAGIQSVPGYSSLPPRRLPELLAETQQQPGLLGLWGASYLLDAADPADARMAAGVEFRAGHPLVGGFAAGGPTELRVPVAARTTPVASLRLVTTMSYGYDVPQGTLVARVELRDQAGQRLIVPVRAGLEIAERASDRPSLSGALQHQKPPGPTALDFEEVTPAGEAYQAHLYLADLKLTAPLNVTEISVTPVHPRALIQVYGIGLVGSEGTVTSLGMADRAGVREVASSPGVRLLALDGGVDRAFLVDQAQAVYRQAFPGQSSAEVISGPGFNPRANVLIEGDGVGYGAPPAVGDTPFTPVGVEEPGPNLLRVRASPGAPSYLVVNDLRYRGWEAFVDGQPAPIYTANGLFRAVRLETGTHLVEFRFQPLSHLVGAALSLLALLTALTAMTCSNLVTRLRHPLHSDTLHPG